MGTNQQHRWLGLSSYEESDSSIFFGRSKEIEELTSAIAFNIQTIIYGPSGIGKTSIIRAGVFEGIRKKGFLPVYVRIDIESEKAYTQQIISAIEEALQKCDYEKESITEDLDTHSLWEYFHGNQFWDSSNYPVIPVIVLDQFEELFTLSSNQDRIDDFFEQLSDLCDAKMPEKVKETLNSKGIRSPYIERNDGYRLVISLREDFLPRLEECSDEIPAFKSNRYSLQALSEEQAMEIVLKPGEGIVSRDVASAIVSKLSFNSNYKISGSKNKIVEPSLLSLFCHELDKRRIERNEDSISSSLLNELGDNIIQDYYNETISNISASSAEYLENALMTKDGYRDNVSVQDALSCGLKKEELKYLLQRRLIHEEEWSGVKRLEYTHDILCKVAKERRDKREEEIRIREEKKKNEQLQQELQRRKRRNSLLVGAIATLILLIGGIYWAFFSHTVAYYENVVLCYEWPKGVNKISESQVKHRPLSYKFEKKGALRTHWTRVTAINGALTPNTDNTFNQVFLETDDQSLRNLDKKYQLLLKKVVSWEFVSDARNINVVQQKAYDRKGDLIYSFSFTGNELIDGKLHRCIGMYVNAAGYPIQSYKNGANNVKITLDGNGYRSRVEFYDAWGNRDKDNNGVYIYTLETSPDGLLQKKVIVNEKGICIYDNQKKSKTNYIYDKTNLVEQQFCDPNGELLNTVFGYAIEKSIYDKNNRLTKKEYYNKEQEKVKIAQKQESPYHAIKYEYDKRGFVSEIQYLDTNNEPIKQGYARVKYYYNEKGMVEKCLFYTNNGDSYVCADSTSGYVNEYDDKNDYSLITQKTNLDENETPTCDASGIVSYKYEYDSNGNTISITNLDKDGNKSNNKAGYATVCYSYDENGNVLSCSYHGIDDKPTINKEKGYSGVNYTYDDRDNLIKEEYFDEHREPVKKDNAYAYIHEYDRFSNRTKTVGKDASGKNISSRIITVNSYDPFGNIVTSEKFKSDEKTPTNGEEGWHKKEIYYDENKFITDEMFYDPSGFLINTPGKSYAVKHIKNDEYGNTVSISYLDDLMEPTAYEGRYKDSLLYESNKVVRNIALDNKSQTLYYTDYKYDAQDRLTEITYKNAKGEENKNSISSKSIKYLDNGNAEVTNYGKGGKAIKKDTVVAGIQQITTINTNTDAKPEYKVLRTKNWVYEGFMKNNVPCGKGKFTWYESGYCIEGYFNGWNVSIKSWKNNENEE